nr:retrovirus-related Pol polyprotein from transposon TNT 1-94 [Tanacetum cinerariifolium]
MLDRTDFASWKQRIRLYCQGKENGVNILKSIDEGPFQMGTVRATNILLQGLPKDIYTLINHYTDAKDIWDNVKMLLEVKLNRGLRDSNYDQLYAYLKQHEAHANENKIMLDRFTQHTVDPLSLMVEVQLGMGEHRTELGMLIQNPDYFKDKMLLMQAQENGMALDEEHLLFLAGGQDKTIDEDVDEQPVQDLGLDVDNVFQADDYDAFDFDVDEAPTEQTMFMANLSSADPVYDKAGQSYDSDILSEVHDHDHYQDAIYEHHEEHEMHDNVKLNHVVDSHANYTSDSNMIPYDQYVKDNTVPGVHSNVSSVPNDAYMMIYNDMYEPHALSVSKTSWNTVVDNSLTAELATYKEQVELYERRSRFDLTEREQKINEQLRIVIIDCNFKEETLKKELYSIKLQLASTINHNKLMVEEVTSLKKDLNEKENKYLEDFLDMKSLKEKVENRLLKQDQSLQTVHMLCRPKPYYNELNKVKIAPHDYSKDNFLATFTPQKQLTLEQIFWSQDLIKMKTEVLKEQTTASRPIKALTMYPPNIPATLVPRVLPMKSHLKIHIFTLIQLFLEFDKTCKKRITPTGLTEWERGFEQTKECYLKEVILFFKTLKKHFEGIQKALTKEIKEMKDVFEELEAEVTENIVDRKHDEIERKILLIANDNLIAEFLSKEVFCVATNSELNVVIFTEMHVANTIVEARCLELEAELYNLRDKSHNDNHNELVNRFSNLEYAIDVEPLPSHLRNNREAHLDYLKHLKESVETIRKMVEEAKVVRPLDSSIVSACRYTKHSPKLLEYAIGTCSKHSCYVHDTNGVELIKGSRGSNLYTISIEDVMKSSQICLLSKASKNKSWLWHRRLNHLNFGNINDLTESYSRRGCSDNADIFQGSDVSVGRICRARTKFGSCSSLCTPTNKDLEILFQPMFDEYLEPPRVERSVSPTPAVQVPVNSAGTPSSTTIDQDAPSPSISSSSSALQSPSLHQGIAAESTLMKDNPVAPVDKNPFINVFAPEPSSDASSSGDVSSTESTYVSKTLHHL